MEDTALSRLLRGDYKRLSTIRSYSSYRNSTFTQGNLTVRGMFGNILLFQYQYSNIPLPRCSDVMKLIDLGWDSFFARHFEQFMDQGFSPARVAREHTHIYLLYSELGELTAEVTGRIRHRAGAKVAFPSIGDWVAVAARPEEGKATIHAVLPRKSSFSRKVAGADTEEQVAAANVDTVFLVSGLDGDFNVRRIERYLTRVHDSGARPVIILNKADLCRDVNARVAEVEGIAPDVPAHVVSALENTGLGALRDYLARGRTAALLGSSGVGKSTLINCLLGTARQPVLEVREDDSRGRHATTNRELVLLPDGGIIIDTPGMREIQIWTDAEGLKRTFADVEEFAAQCRFSDCGHAGEPGCAVREAIEKGELEAARVESYLKLKKEIRELEERQAGKARLAERAQWRKLTRGPGKRGKNRRLDDEENNDELL